jgi:hypothetical protein
MAHEDKVNVPVTAKMLATKKIWDIHRQQSQQVSQQ